MQYTERQRRDAYNYLHAPTEESIWGGTTQPIVDLVNRSFQPGDVLFELSCGDFRMAPVLLHIPGTTVIGTDIIYEALNRRKRANLGSFQDRLLPFLSDVTQPWPIANESIDGILCLNFLHTQDPQTLAHTVFREAMRVLRPGKKFVGNFMVEAVRTHAVTKEILPPGDYVDHEYGEDEAVSFFTYCFAGHALQLDIIRGLNLEARDTNPPYKLIAKSMVFEVQRLR